MTTKSTQTDDEIQEQWDRAARALEQRLRPYMQDLIRWEFAQTFMRDLATQGFRPPLRPPKKAEPIDHEAARAATARGAELARQILARRDDP